MLGCTFYRIVANGIVEKLKLLRIIIQKRTYGKSSEEEIIFSVLLI
jgi:hypothetical protein